MRSTDAVAPLYIRKSMTINVMGAVIYGGAAAVFGSLIVRAIVLGRFDRIPGMTWAWFFVALGMTVWTCRDAFDRGVIVTLDSEGFRDRRTADGQILWRDVRKVSRSDGRGAEGSTGVAFHIGPDDGSRTIRVDTNALDAGNDAILDFVRRAAPHVQVFDQVVRWPS